MRRQTCVAWAHFSAALGLLLALTPLAGCGGNYGCGAGYSIQNPALELTGVTDSHTGAAISRVVLSNIRFGGSAVTDLRSLVPPALAHGVTIAGDTLVCDVPCGFGLSSGAYQFTATAAGYQAATKEFTGGQTFDSGDCPTSTTGSTRIRFTLDPQ